MPKPPQPPPAEPISVAKPVAAPQPPPLRAKLRPLSHKQRCEIFGTFSFKYIPTKDAPERIEINREWLGSNIVVLPLRHLSFINGGAPVNARVHRLAAPRWLELFDAWRDAQLIPKVLTYNGSFVARYKRGKGGGSLEDLSNHSWGTAMDLNAQWNRLGQRPAGADKLGSVLSLVAIANEHGFAWGGDFTNPDGMHFELVRL